MVNLLVEEFPILPQDPIHLDQDASYAPPVVINDSYIHTVSTEDVQIL